MNCLSWLQHAKKTWWSMESSAQKHIKKADARWAAISVQCALSRVYKPAKQCRDRWESLTTDFNKIDNWERFGSNSERSSYWHMNKANRESHKLSKTFCLCVYESIYRFCCNKAIRANGTIDLACSTNHPLQEGKMMHIVTWMNHKCVLSCLVMSKQ